MPDHLHLLLTPAEAVSLEKAIQMIKGGFAHKIRRELLYRFPVWQPGFHDRWIRTVEEFRSRLDYIARNPVVARLAESPSEYEWSSAKGKFTMDRSQLVAGTSGAKARVSIAVDVAVETATHKAHAAAK